MSWMLRAKKLLLLITILLSCVAYSQDYELYTGIAFHERADIKTGYQIGANFIINTNQDRDYLNNIIFGAEHSGYIGRKRNVVITNGAFIDASDCDCESSGLGIADDVSFNYRHLIRAVTLNMGVEIKNNWYLMSGITNYQHINNINSKKVSEYRVNHINAGVKKFIKFDKWIFSPTLMFNPEIVSFSIGISYKY